MIITLSILFTVWLLLWVFIWVKAVHQIGKYLSWRRLLRYIDNDTCMCGAVGGSCAMEQSHAFVSTREYWLTQKPKFT